MAYIRVFDAFIMGKDGRPISRDKRGKKPLNYKFHNGLLQGWATGACKN